MLKNRICAAYGSNMNLKQMEYRCPTARVIGTGVVKGYELLFRGIEGRSVATIEPKARCRVPVVLWEIEPQDEKSLDLYEGFPRLYRKEIVKVTLDNGENIEAMVYVINYGKIASPSDYYAQVIEQGYRDNNLNPSYLKRAIKKCSK